MKNYWESLKDQITTRWDITDEELLNTHGDLNALIQLVALRSGKKENEARDLLNLMMVRPPKKKPVQ